MDNADELYLRGREYYDGDGVITDKPLAEQFFYAAAQYGDKRAAKMLDEIALFDLLEKTLPETDTVEERIEQLLFEGYDDSKPCVDAGEVYYKAMELYKTEDYLNAARFFKNAALMGHAGAEYMLSILYDKAQGVDYDRTKSKMWCEMSASQGYAPAQCRMGNIYNFWKLFVPGEEHKLAFEWYLKAAQQDHAEACRRLSSMYILGHGTKTDFDKAHDYMRKAAELGDTDALYTVGCYYYDGNGVKKDRDTAVEYFKKAFRAGNKTAGKRLKKMGIIPKDD